VLSDRDLAEMRDAASGILVSWVSIHRGVEVNTNGDVSKTWAVSSRVKGQLYPTKPSERVFAERVAGVTEWTVVVAWSTDVTTRDRIVVGPRVLEVEGVDLSRSWQLVKVCSCTEVV